MRATQEKVVVSVNDVIMGPSCGQRSILALEIERNYAPRRQVVTAHVFRLSHPFADDRIEPA